MVNGEYPKIFLPIGSKVDVISIGRTKDTNVQYAKLSYNGKRLDVYGEGIRLDDGLQSTQTPNAAPAQTQDTQPTAETTDKQLTSTASNSAITQANQTATSNINASAYRGRNNEAFQFLITGTSSGRVWGSGPYTDDSNIAKTAVHAGKIRDGETGWVTIRIMPGQSSYQGSNANGVETEGYGSYDGSYVFE